MKESTDEGKLRVSQLLALIVGFVKPFKSILILSIFLNSIFSFLNTVAIGLVKPVFSILFDVDKSEAPKDKNFLERLESTFYNSVESIIHSESGVEYTLLNLGLLIISVFFLKNIFKYISSVVTVKLEEGIVKHIRDRVFSSLTALSVDFFSKTREGSLISVVANDVQILNGTTISSLTIILRETVQILLFLTLLTGISVKLTLIAFSTSLLSFLVIRISMKYLRRYASRMQTAMADYTTTLQETISGIRVVKAYNAESSANKRFFGDTGRFVRSAVKHQKIITLIPAVSEVMAITALCVVLIVGGNEVFKGEMRSDNLMAFLFFLFAIMNPIATVINSIAQFQRGLIAANRVNKVLSRKASVEEGSSVNVEFNKKIEFNNLSFAYENETVLKDITLTIPKSKKIAFVGHSGSGKSTALDLLIRFYDPTSGEIMLDGRSIKEFKISEYRSLFGIVGQESMLFNDTITNNISFGYENVKNEEIIKAAKLANAYDFIMKLPQGFDTNIGDRGILLSGGEKQRISIARALVRNPEILIFDEATSSLDAESEKVVQEAINDSLKDRTAVIVAHRLSTIIDCDEILVFDSGKIIEVGNHKELLQLNGVYRKLYDIQFSQKQLNNETID